MKFDLDYIEKLVNIFSDSDLTEITLEDMDKAIVLRREKEVVTAATVPMTAPVTTQAPLASTVTSQVITESKPAIEAPTKKGTPITSPMVGTFYQAPSPDSAPFASVGDTVATGQVVCIIEAMKLMNEIEAEVSGKIVEICVKDGEPVEYGQVLMYVE